MNQALQPGIFQITGRFARNHHDFDDLSQEICLRLWKSLPALRDTIAFPAWFKSLAVRACYDWLRRRRSRQDHEVSHEQLAGTPDLPEEPPGEDRPAVAPQSGFTLLWRNSNPPPGWCSHFWNWKITPSRRWPLLPAGAAEMSGCVPIARELRCGGYSPHRRPRQADPAAITP
jgi:RNA polymerase sigma factor (sigma-70 family)